MSNLVFILLEVAVPFLSIGLGALVFSGQSIGIAVALVIFLFLVLSCGCYYLSSAWQKKIRAPAMAIEYEAILLSQTSDSSAMLGLDVPYIFALGRLGHIAIIIAIAGVIFTLSTGESIDILIGKGVLLAVLIWLLIRNSKASPFFVPRLIASREGIRSQKYVIPWRDVVNVYVSSSRGNPLCVQTARGLSAYRIGGNGQDLPYEAKAVELSALGMWRTDAVQYLQIRRRLTCEHSMMKN